MSQRLPIALAISDKNCELLTGRPWRWVREYAEQHKVRRLPGTKIPVFDAQALLALFELDNSGAESNPVSVDDGFDVDDILGEVGVRRARGTR